MTDNNDSERIDVWLWAVRFYKTRSLASDACRKGWVTVKGQRVKPARGVRIGDELSIRHQNIDKTVAVRGLLRRRVGGKAVEQYCEDRTPPEVYARAEEQRKLRRQRREIEEVILEAEQREAVYRKWDEGFNKKGGR